MSDINSSTFKLNKSNDEIHSLLGKKVAEHYLDLSEKNTTYKLGRLSENYFSFTFSVEVQKDGEKRGVYVKIPKTDMRRSNRTILPIEIEDTEMALAEQASLKYLEKNWHSDDLSLNWVNLRGFINEYNAIITDRVVADEAYSVFRQWDLKRRVGLGIYSRRLQHVMGRFGKALGRFHHKHVKPAKLNLKNEVPKFEFYFREIAQKTASTSSSLIFSRIRSLFKLNLNGLIVQTMKGIDVRNILIDHKDRLTLLDPGKFKNTFAEADLARFIMTYRILYWGSGWLLFVRQPDYKAEAAFLNEYYSVCSPASKNLLGLYLIKEQLKHWHTALDSLAKLSWHTKIKEWVARIYVNPFYERLLTLELKNLRQAVSCE